MRKRKTKPSERGVVHFCLSDAIDLPVLSCLPWHWHSYMMVIFVSFSYHILVQSLIIHSAITCSCCLSHLVPTSSFQTSHYSSSTPHPLPTPLTAGSNLPQPVQSHICLMGQPSRGAPPAPRTTASFPVSLFLPPLSQPQALCYQALSLCPTLVYQKSGPFSQPWMSKSMHLEQATALGAKESGMHDELWNPFPDNFRISVSARALDQWMGTCVTNQKILLGKCLGGKICSLLLWQTEGLMKILQGWPENKPLLIYVLNSGIA